MGHFNLRAILKGWARETFSPQGAGGGGHTQTVTLSRRVGGGGGRIKSWIRRDFPILHPPPPPPPLSVFNDRSLRRQAGVRRGAF